MHVTIPSQTISIPSISVGSSGLMAIYSDYNSNYTIDVTGEFIEALAQNIIDLEMTQFRKEHPDLDYDKIQEMLYSKDIEMNELAYSMLAETKYTVSLLIGIRTISMSILTSNIIAYNSNNKGNITGKIR